MPDRSAASEVTTESCAGARDEQFTSDSELSNNTARSLTDRTTQVYDNVTVLHPNTNSNSHEDEEKFHVGNVESDVQKHETRESNVQTHETRESNVQTHETRESDVQTHETRESNVQTHETRESDVQTHETRESDVQAHETRESNVQTHETIESNVQTQPEPSSRSSLPKINSFVKGNGKRWNGKAQTLTNVVNKLNNRASPLAPQQTPSPTWMSSLFPASFASNAPPSAVTPSNETEHGEMNDNNQLRHKIQTQDPSRTHVYAHMVYTTDNSHGSQQESSKLLPKSHRHANRRKQASLERKRAAAMETLTESNTLLHNLYYPPRHALFPQLDALNFQNLQGYPNYSPFSQIPNDYSWMVNQNTLFHSSNITKKTAALEIPNTSSIKTLPVSTQQKPLFHPSFDGDNKEHEKSTKKNEEMSCARPLKSAPCFPIRKNIGSPAETSSTQSPHFNSTVESTFEKSRIPSPHRSFIREICENDTSDSDFNGIVAKKKRISGDESESVSWITSPHSSLTPHKVNTPIPSPHHSHKALCESLVSTLSLPSPQTPTTTTQSWQVLPNSSEIALTPEQALGNQQYPFLPPQPNICNVSPVGQVATREKDVFYCHICNYFGKSKPEFDSHMNTHFDFNCPHCDYTSRTEGRLKRHIKDFHSERENSSKRHLSDRSKMFKCKHCSFSTTDREKFWEHCRTHISDDKLLQCPHCSFVTEHKHHLEYHLRNHFGSKPFKCEKCNYSCVNKSMLNSHMKSHTKIYPYRCSDCTYASKYCHSLKLHIKKYNHQPAVALNQDGSLPKEDAAENSGLSVGSKSEHSRGQEDLRNDLYNPYFSQMFGKPDGMPVMTPALNNMMSFWPMLHHTGIPHDISMHSGMLNRAMVFNQLMGIDAVRNDGRKLEGESKNTNKNEREEINGRLDNKNLACKKCNLTFKSTKALCHHIIQMHNTAKKAAEYQGSNEEVPTDKLSRNSYNSDLKNHQFSQPLSVPDDQQGKLNQKNSGSSILPKVKSDHRNKQRAQKTESPNILPASRPLFVCPDKISSERKLKKMHQNVTIRNNKNENIRDPTNRADSMQQVKQATLNCAPETYCDKKILLSEQIFQEEKMHIQNAVTDLKIAYGSRCSPSPLDLSQQKPSTVFSNLDSLVNKDNDNINSDEDNLSNEATSLSKAAEVLLNKHIISEGENTINSNISIDEVIIPKKRPRKGKAYKLNTTCLKRQKTEADSSCDEAEPESVTETTFDIYRPLQSTEEDKQIGKSNITQVQECKPKIISNQNILNGENDLGLYDEQFKYLEISNPEKMVDESVKKNDAEISQNIKKEIEIKEKNNMKSDVETIENSEDDKLFLDDAELELYKLQRSLFYQSEQLEPHSKKSETCQVDTQFVTIIESTSDKFRVGRHAQENLSTVSACNKAASGSEDTMVHSEKNIDQLNKAEMRNSDTEEQNETICSPAKRSTDLVWRMMKEGVTPLPSELLVVNSPSQTQAGMSSSVPHSSLPGLSVRVNNHLASNNDIKPTDVGQFFSHPNYSNSSQPSDTHAPSSALLMKPPANLHVSTPKAYIHPTNRMMSGPTVVPPTSACKRDKKLYECTHCELSFGDCVMYTVHMGYHNKQNPFQCNNCGVVSEDKVEFFLHMTRSSHV